MASNDEKRPLEGVEHGMNETPDDIHAMLKEAEMIDNETGFGSAVESYWLDASKEVQPKPAKQQNKHISAHAYKELKKTVGQEKSPSASAVLDRFKNLNQKKNSVDPSLVDDLKNSLSNKTHSNESSNANTRVAKTNTTIDKLEQPDSRTELRRVASSNLENLAKTGELSSYDDAVKALEKMGLDINRKNRTGGSISISHPELVDKNGRPIKARIKTSDLHEDAANIVFKESIDRKAKKAAKEEQRKAAVKFTEVTDSSLMKNEKQGVPNKPISLTFPPPPDIHASLTDKVKKSEKLSLSKNSPYTAEHVNSSMNLYKHPSTSEMASNAPKYAGSGVVANSGVTKSRKPAQPSQYKTTPLSDNNKGKSSNGKNSKKNTKFKNAKDGSKKDALPKNKNPDVSQKNKEHPNHPENAGKPNTGVVDEAGNKKQTYSSNYTPDEGPLGPGFTIGANISGATDAASRAIKGGSKVASKAYQGAKKTITSVRQSRKGNSNQSANRQGLFNNLDSSNPAHNLPNLTKQALNKAHNASLTSQEALLDIERGGLSPSEKTRKTKSLNDGFRDYADAGSEAARSLESNSSIDNKTKEAGAKLLEGMQKDVTNNSRKAKSKSLLDSDNEKNLADKLKKIKEMIDRVMQTLTNIANAAMALAGRRP